jgi:hypothetical protein
MTSTVPAVQLKPETIERFASYIREIESAMEQNLERSEPFLWAEADPRRARQVQSGKVIADFFSGKGPMKLPNGLIHDWVGAASITGTTLKEVLDLVQDYDHHKEIYKPEVIASKLVNREENDFQIYLRLLKKKFITVVLDTDHKVHYRRVDQTRWVCHSHTTRIAEVEGAGTSKERVLPPDTGYGFLWRLNSYWRFQEHDRGVDIECRAISLTRDVPFGLAWVIEPIIQKLPKESLIGTLAATRKAIQPKTH